MSVLINTNSAATLAANNLAASNGLLQRSLNRLSSGSKIVNPADDAGGLAVSMKLSAAARRQGAANTNLGNSVSFLQSQDGVLKAAGKVLERIGELKTLASDPTKNSTDLANYDAEFTALAAQLTSLGAEKFNGIALFGSTTLAVDATAEPGGSTIDIGGADLLGSGAAASGASLFSDNFSSLANWTDNSFGVGSPSISAASNTLSLNVPVSGWATATSGQNFSGAFEVNLDVRFSGTNGAFSLSLGSDTLTTVTKSDVNDSNWHSVRMVFDGAGTALTYLDGSSTPSGIETGLATTSGNLVMENFGNGSSDVRNFAVNEVASSASNTGTIAAAGNLTSVSLSTITSAIQDVATFRATNGAQQSRLGFASEVLATNKANLEAANSRITDVDVAEESTALARYNVLVQAGTSMLAQANQSAQTALRLLG